jgi:hypothetical protein
LVYLFILFLNSENNNNSVDTEEDAGSSVNFSNNTEENLFTQKLQIVRKTNKRTNTQKTKTLLTYTTKQNKKQNENNNAAVVPNERNQRKEIKTKEENKKKKKQTNKQKPAPKQANIKSACTHKQTNKRRMKIIILPWVLLLFQTNEIRVTVF